MAKSKLSYGEAISQIEEILQQIENEELDVDELSGKVKKAAELLSLCKNKLHETEEEVDRILKEIEKEE